jgi:hypothetical protein
MCDLVRCSGFRECQSEICPCHTIHKRQYVCEEGCVDHADCTPYPPYAISVDGYLLERANES